jgi:hypothetical protein
MMESTTKTPAELWNSHPRWQRVAVYITLGLLGCIVLLAAVAPEPEAKPEPVATQSVDKQFSPWDGSHMATAKAIKAELNDPDSYKHFETRYWVRNDGSLKVVTEIGARNGFGGMQRAVFESIISPAGEVTNLTQLQ